MHSLTKTLLLVFAKISAKQTKINNVDFDARHKSFVLLSATYSSHPNLSQCDWDKSSHSDKLINGN